ncbi:hypothetical protein IG895_004835, partial [Salmonella enterica]|nr:hypothetical protein [Salmonella enterica]EHV1860206.1 hypothetical protein [Salmonella enterica]EIG1930642.1 hypothetical protein [Salmonella enterica]EIJ8661059.1 hypothetical protein [Salmonella enterica]EJF5065288.1 hypothetical protein [Salmonella enterica]
FPICLVVNLPEANAATEHKFRKIIQAGPFPDTATRRFYKHRNILIAPYSKQAPAASVSLNGGYARQNTSLVQISERRFLPGYYSHIYKPKKC